jgi:hypothetical protein
MFASREGILLGALALAAAVTVPLGVAQAATVETKSAIMLRDRPEARGRVVERVPAHKKLSVVGRTPDSTWLHVKGSKTDGWAPASTLKGADAIVKGRRGPARAEEESTEGEGEEEARPLAKRRNVRPEAWVSKSRYHDGGEEKVTVSATRADLYGRPQAIGSVVGVLRRGESVIVVKRSTDKKWIMVDIGGGDVAWLEAKNTKPGAAHAPGQSSAIQGAVDEVPVEDEAPVAAKGKKGKAAPVEVAVSEPEPPPPPAPAPPPPAAGKKGRKGAQQTPAQLRAETEAKERADEERARREAMARAAASDDEAPPGMAPSKRSSSSEEERPAPPPAVAEKPSKRSKRAIKVASRGDLSGLGDTSSSGDTTVVRSWSKLGPNNALGLGVRAGVAILSQRFTSNAVGTLTNYEANTTAFSAQVGAGYQRSVGKYFRFAIDASYAFIGAAGVRYQTSTGNAPVLAVQTHVIDGGLAPGVHFDKAGGIDLKLRLGINITTNLIETTQQLAPPSDQIIGMTAGLSLAFPSLFTVKGRSFGLAGYAGVLAPAKRFQVVNLEDGKDSTTIGASFAGVASMQLWKGLGMEAAYTYSFAATHFTGPASRNNAITEADRGSAHHLILLGLTYSL